MAMSFLLFFLHLSCPPAWSKSFWTHVTGDSPLVQKSVLSLDVDCVHCVLKNIRIRSSNLFPICPSFYVVLKINKKTSISWLHPTYKMVKYKCPSCHHTYLNYLDLSIQNHCAHNTFTQNVSKWLQELPMFINVCLSSSLYIDHDHPEEKKTRWYFSKVLYQNLKKTVNIGK